MMQLSPYGRRVLAKFEGNSLESYHCSKDPYGIFTIGIGHKIVEAEWLKQLRMGRTVVISETTRNRLFAEDVLIAEHLASQLDDTTNPFRFDALTMMCFQMGSQLLSWKNFRHELDENDYLSTGDYPAAALQASRSKWARSQTQDRAWFVLLLLATGVEIDESLIP